MTPTKMPHVSDRDNAAVGCFVTLDPVISLEAKKEVANVGKISIQYEYKRMEYRRMQLWSISEHFENRKPDLPIMNDP